MRRQIAALAATLVLLSVSAPAVLAHPLGNFTINHYAQVRVEPDRVVLDVVIDAAEIPTFQATSGLDLDGDGVLSAAETADLPQARCQAIGRGLSLGIDGAPAALRLTAGGVTFPMGNAGLPTMRASCVFEAPIALAAGGPTEVTFRDDFEAARIGWREITAVGDGVTLVADGLPAASVSDRLRAYPAGLGAAPDVRAASLAVRPGGSRLAPFSVPDVAPFAPVPVEADASAAPGPSAAPRSEAAPGPSAAPRSEAAPAAALPGGEGAIPDILRTLPVTPALALVAFVTAMLLGAGHAVTPGHGKTLMAAYLVGTRGTPRHALGLGAAVSVSHTIGILGLALVVVGAESALPPDLVVRVAPVIAAVTILGIGGWMLLTELRRWHAARRSREADAAGTGRAHTHADGHAHGGAPHGHAHGGAPHGHAHADHEHAHEHGHAVGHAHDGADHDHGANERITRERHAVGPLEHSHGGIRHRHVPPAGATITWRSLFVLGLAGGLIPSTNALLILLATIAAGQAAWGVVLVVAFGLGMAGVMAGVGLAFVYARGLLERGAARPGLRQVARLVPLGAAVLVLAVGVVLTTQALGSVRLV